MYISKLFDLTLFETKYKQQLIELVAYSFIAFFIPFFIGHPQMLVGTMVNATLILSSVYLKRNFLLPIIFMPSIAVLSRGYNLIIWQLCKSILFIYDSPAFL